MLPPPFRAAPPSNPGPFDPDQFRFKWERVTGREFEWNPGQRIRVFRPGVAVTPRKLVPVVLVVALSFGLIGGVFTGLLAGWKWTPVALAAAVVLGFGAALVGAWLHREMEVVFDWRSGRALFREGKRRRSVPLDAIRRIILRGRTEKHGGGASPVHGGSSSSIRLHGCEVLADAGGRKERVALSECYRSTETPYRRSAPMASELAEALGVPWEWEPYPLTMRQRLVRLLKGK